LTEEEDPFCSAFEQIQGVQREVQSVPSEREKEVDAQIPSKRSN